MRSSIARQFDVDGFAVIPDFLHDLDIEELARQLTQVPGEHAGTRKLLNADWCANLGERLRIDRRLRELYPTEAVTVQCTLFVKSPTRNWLVSLHQDLSVPVAGRVGSDQCSGWSEKEGDVFVQPPNAVLEQLVAVRLHLDDCDERNGALRVVPGSHRFGRLTSDETTSERSLRGEHSVPVSRGGAMVMRPLLLHASSKATTELRRRVLHFVFGPSALPEGLRWPSRESS